MRTAPVVAELCEDKSMLMGSLIQNMIFVLTVSGDEVRFHRCQSVSGLRQTAAEARVVVVASTF